MKTLFKLTLVSVILALVAFGCKKPAQPDQATTNDVRTAELAQSDVFTFSQQTDGNDKAFSKDSSCYDVDIDENNDGSFTTTFTFDSSCTFSDGVVRSGQIIITWFPGWRFDTTKHTTVTFNNYTRDSIKLSGTVTISFTGGSLDATLSYTMTEENMNITFADGKTTSWRGTRTVEWTAGFRTILDRDDDVKKVNFHREGINRNGEAYTADGTDLLIKNSCGDTRKSRVVSGTIVIKKGDQTTTVDFGNGDCDDTFTITQNGVTVTVNG